MVRVALVKPVSKRTPKISRDLSKSSSSYALRALAQVSSSSWGEVRKRRGWKELAYLEGHGGRWGKRARRGEEQDYILLSGK